MKPYALHMLIVATIHVNNRIPALGSQISLRNPDTIGIVNPNTEAELVSLAHAHEIGEVEGPHSEYVWGCQAGTNRAGRRLARLKGVLEALGNPVVGVETKALLTSCHNRLRARLRVISAALVRAGIQGRTARRIDRFARNEGLISALWQAWGNFSRSSVLLSARGTLTSSGVRTSSNYSHLSESELLFVCRTASNGNPIGAIRPLKGNHLEPTWGDARRINRIVRAIQPSNEATLITGLV